MQNTQNNSPSELETLASTQQFAFVITILWLFISTLVTAGLGIWAYAANERLAAAIQRDANNKIADATTTARKAERRASEAEKLGRPRGFTDEQRKRFIEILRNTPKTSINIVCGDGEACGFAKQIDSALRDAGYTDVRGGGGSVQAVLIPFVGMRLVQRNEGVEIPAMKAVADAFFAAGIQLEILADDKLPENELWLWIGTKP